MVFDPEIWQGLREMSPGIYQHYQKEVEAIIILSRKKKAMFFQLPCQFWRGDPSIGGLTFENGGRLDFIIMYNYYITTL